MDISSALEVLDLGSIGCIVQLQESVLILKVRHPVPRWRLGHIRRALRRMRGKIVTLYYGKGR